MRFTTKVGAGLMCCAAGTITGYTTARDSYPDDLPAPGFLDVIGWLSSGEDGWALAAAIFAFISAVYSVWEWFQAGPPTIEEIGATVGTAIAPVRDNVNELSGQIWQEGQVADRRHEEAMAGQEDTRAAVTAGTDEVLAAITQDKIAATLKELERADADPALLAEFERVIRIAKERNLPITEEQAAGIAETAARMGRSNRPGDDEIARLIEEGDYRGAARRKAELARSRIEETKKQEAAELRDAATLALPFAPSEARDYLAHATELDPTDLWSWIELGRLRAAYDGLQAARNCFNAALQQVADERNRMVIHGEFGNLLIAEGQLPLAFTEYEAALAIAERLAASDPGNAGWQRDLSVSHNKIGDVAQAAGDLAAARRAYDASLAIRERLVASDPGNAEWQRDFSVSHIKIGEVAQAAGDLAAARSAYEAGLAIRESLAASDPGNAGWQRDLSVSHEKIGDVAQAAGDLAAARSAYAAGLAIRQRLAASDPGNAGWQRDLSVSHNKIGEVAQAAGDLAAARSAYEASLDICERLAASDPSNAEWQRDVCVSYWKMAQIGDPAYPWSRVVTKLEEMHAAGTLAPVDMEFLEEARRLAAG